MELVGDGGAGGLELFARTGTVVGRQRRQCEAVPERARSELGIAADTSMIIVAGTSRPRR
jgi:hypothetical protein